jgi:hypothetical protein
MPQKSFGHLAAARVAGTEEEHALFIVAHRFFRYFQFTKSSKNWSRRLQGMADISYCESAS